MNRQLRTPVLSRVALVAFVVLALCDAGRAQNPSPSVTITSPATGSTIKSAYFYITATTANFYNVNSVTAVVTNNAGHQSSVAMTLSNGSWMCQFNPSDLIPSGATSYNDTVTIQATAQGTVASDTGYNPFSPASATSSPVTVTIQVEYILGQSGNTTKVTAPTNGATIHLTGSPFTTSSDHHFDFYRYDT